MAIKCVAGVPECLFDTIVSLDYIPDHMKSHLKQEVSSFLA